MTVLEWILLLEAVLIVAAGIFAVIGMVIAKSDPDDPISVFCRVFWRWFIYPPVEAADGADLDSRLAARPKRADGQNEADDVPEIPSGESGDSFYGRVPTGQDGVIHTVNMTVIVLPHAVSEMVLGREGSDAIQVQVSSAAEDGAANKSIIQLVAGAVGVKPYQVTLTKGHYGARKVVQIAGVDQRQLERRLESLPEL